PHARRYPSFSDIYGSALLETTDHSVTKIHLLYEGRRNLGYPLLLEIHQDNAAQRVKHSFLIGLGLICWVRTKGEFFQASLSTLIFEEKCLRDDPKEIGGFYLVCLMVFLELQACLRILHQVAESIVVLLSF